MAKNLVIVESPTKAKTIEGFLGKEYTVKASEGHVRDLNKNTLSVDIDNNFEPEYEIPDNKKALVAELKKLSKPPTRYGWHPMRTARENPSRGISMRCST